MKDLIKTTAITMAALIAICFLCAIIAVAYHFAPNVAPYLFAGVAVGSVWKYVYRIIKSKPEDETRD